MGDAEHDVRTKGAMCARVRIQCGDQKVRDTE
jgi:hypothetical protein